MVKFIDYEGQQIPYSVGYYALKRFKGETGKDFEETDDNDLEALEIIAWYSIEAGCKIEKIENPLTREDIELFLNSCMVEFSQSIPDSFLIPPKKGQRPTGGGTNKTAGKASSRSRKKTSPKK